MKKALSLFLGHFTLYLHFVALVGLHNIFIVCFDCD